MGSPLSIASLAGDLKVAYNTIKSGSPYSSGSMLYTVLRQLAERDPRVAVDARVLLNDRSGPLAYKTDALGALLNARIAAGGQSPRAVIAADRRWRPRPVPPPDRMRRLQYLLR